LVTLLFDGNVLEAEDGQMLSNVRITSKKKKEKKTQNVRITSGMQMTILLGDPVALSQKIQDLNEVYSREMDLKLKVSIGTFGHHDDSAGIALLREPSTFIDFPPIHDELLQIIAHTKGFPGAKFQSVTNKLALQVEQRELLMKILDEQCGDNKDFKLNISHADFSGLLGAETVRSLAEIFPGGDYNEIKLRRCCDYGKCINFHTDYALHTMQIPLNDDDEYSGGRLVYLNSDGLHVPPRPAGSVTIHDNTIVHGVTLLEKGVRYGLFLLKTA